MKIIAQPLASLICLIDYRDPMIEQRQVYFVSECMQINLTLWEEKYTTCFTSKVYQKKYYQNSSNLSDWNHTIKIVWHKLPLLNSIYASSCFLRTIVVEIRADVQPTSKSNTLNARRLRAGQCFLNTHSPYLIVNLKQNKLMFRYTSEWKNYLIHHVSNMHFVSMSAEYPHHSLNEEWTLLIIPMSNMACVKSINNRITEVTTTNLFLFVNKTLLTQRGSMANQNVIQNSLKFRNRWLRYRVFFRFDTAKSVCHTRHSLAASRRVGIHSNIRLWNASEKTKHLK